MIRVVTIGGGHGQAALLSALLHVECEITAVVSIADDGGCSGKIRRETGMAPPGDVRRCLSTLAADRELAEKFEERLQLPGVEGRSAGNLVLAQMYRELGSLQGAVDWASTLLACRGRVLPAAEEPGVLTVYDSQAGEVAGESTVGQRALAPVVAKVDGPTQANPEALQAIEEADWVFLGPGSFVTSVLAALSTADVAAAVARSRGRCVLLTNLAPEGDVLAGYRSSDYVRLLRDHIMIHSEGHDVPLAVLGHHAEGHMRGVLEDGTPEMRSPLSSGEERVHVPERVAEALMTHYGFEARRRASSVAGDIREQARGLFASKLDRALSWLQRAQLRSAAGI